MVVTCYPFLHILAVRRPPSKPRQSSASDGSVTNLKSLSLTARTHASRSASRLNLTPTIHAHRAPGSIALWLSFPGLVGELGFVSGVECLDNCALGLIDLGLDLEHHGLVDW